MTRPRVSIYASVSIVIAICILIAALFYTRPLFFSGSQPSTKIPKVHSYNNPSVNIANIALKFFYVVPKNKKSTLYPGWHYVAAKALGEIAQFHALQFRGTSALRVDLFPEPVILSHDDVYYDTASTNNGNPHGLVGIAQELENRIFRKDGDLYDEHFAKTTEDEYPIMGILYEGVGASGGLIYESSLESVEDIARQLKIPESIIFKVDIQSANGFFLLNREYLTDDVYKQYGSSFLYHEFAHTLGFPDQYIKDRAFSSDIMGDGRTRPIDRNYIDRDLLKGAGVIQDVL